MTIDLEELQKKKAAELTTDTGVEEVITAFLVVQAKDGQWAAYADFANMDLSMERASNLDDLIGGCANIQASCASQQTAVATAMMMEQRAAMMQQQLMQQREAQKVSSLLDPKMLRNNQ